MRLEVRSMGVRIASAMLALCAGSLGERVHAARPQDAAQKFEALVQRYDAQRSEFYAALKAAKSDDERSKLMEKQPGKEFVREFRDLAASAAGSDVALKAWLRVIDIGPDVGETRTAIDALEIVVEDHSASAELASLPPMLRYAGLSLGAEPVERALRKLADRSPHANVKAGALFTLASILASDHPSDSPQAKEARRLFQQVIDDYGDAKTSRGKSYREAAESYVFELERLQIGMVAPDFEAVDENGVPFKLSDHRGKVTVVAFWGFW